MHTGFELCRLRRRSGKPAHEARPRVIPIPLYNGVMTNHFLVNGRNLGVVRRIPLRLVVRSDKPPPSAWYCRSVVRPQAGPATRGRVYPLGAKGVACMVLYNMQHCPHIAVKAGQRVHRCASVSWAVRASWTTGRCRRLQQKAYTCYAAECLVFSGRKTNVAWGSSI